MTRSITRLSVLTIALAAACDGSSPSLLDDTAPSAARSEGVQVWTHGDRSAASYHARSGTSLFTVDADQSVADALIGWLQETGYHGVDRETVIALTEAKRSPFGALEVVHFDQDYRGSEFNR